MIDFQVGDVFINEHYREIGQITGMEEYLYLYIHLDSKYKDWFTAKSPFHKGCIQLTPEQSLEYKAREV